jgi:hypothetical protein
MAGIIINIKIAFSVDERQILKVEFLADAFHVSHILLAWIYDSIIKIMVSMAVKRHPAK